MVFSNSKSNYLSIQKQQQQMNKKSIWEVNDSEFWIGNLESMFFEISLWMIQNFHEARRIFVTVQEIYWSIIIPFLMWIWFLFWQRHEVWPVVLPNWLQGLAGLTTKVRIFWRICIQFSITKFKKITSLRNSWPYDCKFLALLPIKPNLCY